MVKMGTRVHKISILIIAFIILDFFIVVFGNMLIDEKEFGIKEGEYTYDELFYSPSSEKSYYQISKNYYSGDSKYMVGDDVFRILKFKAVDEFKALTILSFVPKTSFLGWYSLSDCNMTEQELQSAYERKDYIYYGYIYNIFNKTYFYGYLKDFVYIEDNEFSKEDNFYLATKTKNSNTVAFFEIEGLDLSVVKQGNNSKVLHHKGFVDVFNRPYCYIFSVICFVELAILLMVAKKRSDI